MSASPRAPSAPPPAPLHLLLVHRHHSLAPVKFAPAIRGEAHPPAGCIAAVEVQGDSLLIRAKALPTSALVYNKAPLQLATTWKIYPIPP